MQKREMEEGTSVPPLDILSCSYLNNSIHVTRFGSLLIIASRIFVRLITSLGFLINHKC